MWPYLLKQTVLLKSMCGQSVTDPPTGSGHLGILVWQARPHRQADTFREHLKRGRKHIDGAKLMQA